MLIEKPHALQKQMLHVLALKKEWNVFRILKFAVLVMERNKYLKKILFIINVLKLFILVPFFSLKELKFYKRSIFVGSIPN